MKKNNVAGLLALSTALSVTALAAPSVAIAATASHNMTKSQIVFNGATMSQPYRFVAGNPATTYIPIFYVQQLLNKAANLTTAQDVWDGTAHTWTLTVTGASVHQVSNGSGASVVVNGTSVEKAPTLVDVDPSSGQETTFMPIWYVQQVVDQLLNLNSKTDQWNGSLGVPTWSISTSGSSSTGTGVSAEDSELQSQASAYYNSITWHDDGSYRIFSAPIFTTKGPWELTSVIGGPNVLQYSLDNGVTWHNPRSYDSFQTARGGVTSIPSGVTHILLRGPKTDIAYFDLCKIGNKSNAAVGSLQVSPTGSKQLSLQVLGTYS